MARLVYHEHPRQGGSCLQGAFAAYVRRIPVDDYRNLDELWQAVRRRPYEADFGDASASDDRCDPPQRSLIWPGTMNCWQAAAHFTAGALHFLDDSWIVHIWDRDLPSGERHVWPSLTQGRHHLLVDLSTLSPAKYKLGVYSGLVVPSSAANAEGDDGSSEQETASPDGGEDAGPQWYNHLLGGAHAGGKVALSIFGLGGLGNVLEDVEREHLPDWAKSAPKEQQPAARKPPRRAPARPPEPERDPEPDAEPDAESDPEPNRRPTGRRQSLLFLGKRRHKNNTAPDEERLGNRRT
jgi:hypothetical protein